MGKKWNKIGIVASRTKAADESWNRESDFSGVREVHLKFFVHDEEGQIPHGCPLDQPNWREFDKRALQHELARGDQFIKNVVGVTPSGLGRRLLESGFAFAKFSHHIKDTLHQTDRKVVVECVFSKSPGGETMEWKDSILGWYLSTVWRVHAYKNPGGIMTINMVHPARGRMRASKVFRVDAGSISIVSVG